MQARVLESMAEGVSVCDESGLVTYTNPAFNEMFGYPDGELAGKHITILNNNSDRENEIIFRKIALHLLQNGNWSGEFANRKKNGSVLFTFARISTLEIAGHRYWITVQEDITERKRALEQIQSLNTHLAERTGELEEANRRLQAANQELGAFNYTVSHDLRSPLASIHLSAQMALDLHGNSLTGECRQFIESIIGHAERMEDLIDALLGLADVSQRKLEKKVVDLSAIARQVAAALQHIEPARQVEFRLADDIMVQGDEHLLYGMMENLFTNAWKFTRDRQPAIIEFGVTGTGSARTFFVRDNGVGFDMARAGKLFETFQRLHRKEEFEGHGIGLATIKRIITRHAGEIWAEAEADHGATFHFTLPC